MMRISPGGRILLGISCLLIAGLVWAWIGGMIFLTAFDRDPQEAELLTLYQYWYYYRSDASVMKWLLLAGGIALAVVFLPLMLIVFSPTKQSLYGDARFATLLEIRRAGLLGHEGIIVGRLGNKYLMFGGQQHAIISAPTRSGKGVGIVIPNLLNWPESVVVLDIKQENWDITSAFRSRHGQYCYLFNPAASDYRTHRYNPLSYISSDPNFRIDDVQKIANMLFPDMPGVDVIWTATPRSLFLGIVLMLAETPGKPLTLGQVVRESLMEGDGAHYFARLINERADSGKPYSNACVRALNSYISITAENTRAGVMTSFRSRLELWMNPLVDAATSDNDFDLRDVRKKRMSIYLGVTPDNLERMAPLLNLFFQQLIDLNTRELPNQNPAIRHTCLLLMDEFTAIGKIGILSKGISYIAGYGLRMLPIIQSPSQLVEVYGQEGAQNFTTNHALNIVFPPKASEAQTAREISEWLGNQTVAGVMLSKSRSIFKRSFGEQNLQISDQQRPLLLPQEITSLGSGRELVVVENTPPILADKVVYYREKIFLDRLRLVSPSLRAHANKLPDKHQMDDAIRRGELAASVPWIDLEVYQQENGSDVPLKVVAPPKPGGAVKRLPNAQDIVDLGNLPNLSQQVDFSSVKKPEGELTDEKLKAYADDLCRAMGMRID